MIFHLPIRAPRAIALLLAPCALAMVDPLHAQPPLATAGTLTCTVADVPEKRSASMDMSCNFKAQTGTTSDYVGSASAKPGGLPPAKYVFVWMVVAPEEAPILEGNFSAESGRQGPAVLVGGQSGAIRLEPVKGKEQQSGPAGITSLTLKVAATKALWGKAPN